MIHSYDCSDLLVSIVTESDFLDHGLVLRKFERTCKHKHVFHSAYHKPRTCLFFLEIDYDRVTNAERSDKNLDYSIVALY